MPKGIPKSGINKGWFKKGCIVWHAGKTLPYMPRPNRRGKPIGLGRHLSEETKLKISQKLKGNKPWNTGLRGAGNPGWKGGIAPIKQLDRKIFRYNMIKLILERDGYKCQLCGAGRDLHVDHIQSFAEFKELRFNPENCRTLCRPCHYKLTFGKEMPLNSKWGKDTRHVK